MVDREGPFRGGSLTGQTATSCEGQRRDQQFGDRKVEAASCHQLSSVMTVAHAEGAGRDDQREGGQNRWSRISGCYLGAPASQ